MMASGVKAFRTRAVLLTVFSALLVLFALTAFASLPILLLLMAICSMAYLGWTTLLYAAVADTVPARSVAIAAAAGALMANLSGALSPVAFTSLVPVYGSRSVPLGVSAVAAIALILIPLLAWLSRTEPAAA
jgi:MFS family permease